jgi:hypothetical protein
MKDQEKADKENIQDESSRRSETPFFARFLEGQHAESKPHMAGDEASFMTLKYPSDRDEWDPHV